MDLKNIKVLEGLVFFDLKVKLLEYLEMFKNKNLQEKNLKFKGMQIDYRFGFFFRITMFKVQFVFFGFCDLDFFFIYIFFYQKLF